jgi:hypothetical protein
MAVDVGRAGGDRAFTNATCFGVFVNRLVPMADSCDLGAADRAY